jgi:Zn-dependent membrane protease YugP
MLLLAIICMVIPIALGFWASHRVKKTFEKYNQVGALSGMPGYRVARIILDNAGLQHIGVEQVPGELSDHYDPGAKVIRLSDSTYYSTSIAALGVVAHECGHAVQDSKNYAMMAARATLVPIANLGSGIAPFILMGGAMLVATTLGKLLLLIGIVFLAGYALFSLVTLPVEFDASNRAMKIMENEGVLTSQELPMAKEVLGAAAFTYVAAAISAVMTLVYYIMIFLRGREEN